MRSKIYILILFVLSAMARNTSFAQMDSVAKASWILQDTTLTQEVRMKTSMEFIDKFIKHPDAMNSAYAWHTRGIIYKEWYKTFESQNKKSKTRLDAVEFFTKALALDTSKGQLIPIKNNIEYNGNVYMITDVYMVTNTKQILKYLGSTLYNDAGALLDLANYHTAIENYDRFKECFLLAEPNYNFKMREIEFKLALADLYARTFRNDIKVNTQFFEMAEQTYRQVIVLDTNNWGGNYNFAMMYYNYGVDVINAMDVSEDIFVIETIQDQAKELFKKALPYALKAYALNSKNKNVLISLQGIYFSLYEFDKSDEYKAKVEILDKGK